MLPVAVEVAPPNAPREQVTALLGACSRAVADAECVLASDAPEGGTQAVAIVTWQSDGRATVEVGLRREGKPEWRSRNVSFGVADDPVERWRAVGFVVGTLARGEAPGEPTANPTEATPAPKLAEPTPKPSEPVRVVPPKAAPVVLPTHPAHAALELGAVMGPGLDGLRTGGVLHTRWPLYDKLRSLVSVRYVERPSDDNGLRGQWLTVAAGVGGVLGTAHSELGAGIDARVEYFRASADYLGRTGSDSRWLPGFALSVHGAWMPMPVLGLYLAAEGAWMGYSTPIRVKGQPAGEDRALRASIDGGIRLRLW
jgi:hypothetical protein